MNQTTTDRLFLDQSLVENSIAATILFVTAAISFAVNLSASLVAHRLTTLRSSFTRLSVSLACADCGVLTIYMLWAAPMCYLQSTVSLSVVGLKLGQMSLLFWYASIYAMLLVATNRYFGVRQPSRYEKLFSERNTKCFIVGCWVLAVCHTMAFFLPGCEYYFIPDSYQWTYNLSTKCGEFFTDFDLYYAGGIIAVIFLLNIATLLGFRKRNTVFAESHVQDLFEVKRKRKREKLFFIQALLNATAFELMLLSFNVFSKWYDTKWYLLLTTTVAWEASHAANGWLFLIFTGEVRHALLVFIRSGGKRITQPTLRPPPTRVAMHSRAGSVVSHARRQ